MSDKLTRQEAQEQTDLMAKRLAMLYKAFAETAVEELGEEDAKDFILKAIESFGGLCGSRVRQEVEKLGKDLTISNYSSVPDLPWLSWEFDSEVIETDREVIVDINRCPLAEYWADHMDPELARLYCQVDKAKYKAYNDKIQCGHTKNYLDGDDKCQLHVQCKD